MKNKKIKVTFNIIFVLLGLILVFFSFREGFDSNYSWIRLILGSLVVITNIVELLQVNKGEDTSGTSKEK